MGVVWLNYSAPPCSYSSIVCEVTAHARAKKEETLSAALHSQSSCRTNCHLRCSSDLKTIKDPPCPHCSSTNRSRLHVLPSKHHQSGATSQIPGEVKRAPWKRFHLFGGSGQARLEHGRLLLFAIRVADTSTLNCAQSSCAIASCTLTSCQSISTSTVNFCMTFLPLSRTIRIHPQGFSSNSSLLLATAVKRGLTALSGSSKSDRAL